MQSSFTIADEKMALSLYNRRVSLIDVQRAILLGAVRKYAAIVQNGYGTPISGLHYFTSLFEEVQQETSPQYWKYVAQRRKLLSRHGQASTCKKRNNDHVPFYAPSEQEGSRRNNDELSRPMHVLRE